MIVSRNPKDLHITREHTRWMRDGQKYTEAALTRMAEVMRHDMLTEHRVSGEGRVRASMLGDPCVRRQALSFSGDVSEPPSIELQEIFDTGTFGHYKWQLRGLAAGWLAEVEAQVFTDDGTLGGNLDGLLPDGAVFEFKTINPTGFRAVESKAWPLDSHILQVHSYMLAADTDRAHILYEDKSYGSRFYELVVFRDADVEAKLLTLRDLIVGGKPIAPLDGCVKAHGSVYENCSWVSACQPSNWR